MLVNIMKDARSYEQKPCQHVSVKRLPEGEWTVTLHPSGEVVHVPNDAREVYTMSDEGNTTGRIPPRKVEVVR